MTKGQEFGRIQNVRRGNLTDRYIVGVDCGEGPPVPIPNTEVKLCRAEDTWLETARENRYSPTLRQRLEFF